MKKAVKRVLIIFFINWIVVFGFSLALDLFDDLFQYIVSPVILAVVTTFMTITFLKSSKGTSRSKRQTQPSPRSNIDKSKSNVIFICKPLSSDIYYEVKDNRVYRHLSNKIIYEIKGDKIYQQFGAKPILIIKGNKLYSPEETPPKYRIENNKVYEGDFGRVPILSIRSEKDKFNPSK